MKTIIMNGGHAQTMLSNLLQMAGLSTELGSVGADRLNVSSWHQEARLALKGGQVRDWRT